MRKQWNIAAAAGVFTLFAFFACKNNTSASAEIVPKPVADTVIGYFGCDHSQFKPLSAHVFDLTYQHYTVRISDRADTVGQSIVVAPHRGGPRYNVPVPDAAFFSGVNRDFLFVDAGSSPDGRQMIVYDLPGQKEIFRTSYIDTIKILGNGKIWYWKPIEFDLIPVKNKPECSDSASYIANGLHVAYGKRAIYDPSTRVQVAKSEYKCFPGQ